jgi:hypothetical protein
MTTDTKIHPGSANDALAGYTGTDGYTRYHSGLLLTDGVRALAEQFGAFWLLDIVASYQAPVTKPKPEIDMSFQVWKLQRTPDSPEFAANVTCTDGNDNIIFIQGIPYTDFPYAEATIWLTDGVMLLPSEY